MTTDLHDKATHILSKIANSMYTHGPKDMGLVYFTKREIKVLEQELIHLLEEYADDSSYKKFGDIS
jgi:hypothetical protein